MVLVELILIYEMYSCVVFIEVVRHLFDLLLNKSLISAFLSYNEDFSCMLVTCSKLRILAISDSFKSSFYRDSILLCILNTLDTAYCI